MSVARTSASPQQDELQAALADCRPLLRRAVAFAVIGSLLVLTPSWYMLEVYDRVVGSRSTLTLAMLTLLVLGAYAVMEAVDWASGILLHQAGLRFERKLAPRAFEACFTGSLKRIPVGGVQPLQDLRVLREFFPSAAVRAMIEGPVALLFLVLMYMMHPLVGWATLAAALVQGLVAWGNERDTQASLLAANRAAREAQLYADASLRNTQVIEAMGMLPAIRRRWLQRQGEFLQHQAVASDRAGSWQVLSRFVQTSMSSAFLGIAAWLLLRGEMQDAALMIVASIIGGRVLAPIVTATAQWRMVVTARDAWKRLAQLLAALPPRPPAMPLPAPTGRVVAENLMVAAPGSNTPILKGVSFSLNAGEVLAVVGPSAAGKTTLARALVGLWPSAGGKARLDGVDVFSWDHLELGPHVGYLPQGVELFDGSVADNIARFGEADRERVEDAARRVGLHEFILSLPQGYDTEVGSDGARLSGGQRQRLALARALYGKPVFVVLDEPNASLDEAGDAALAQAIATAKARGTTFVIMTHRTSVLAVSDKMLVLADGQAQAFGPRDQVLQALKQRAQQGGAAPARAAGARPAGPSGVAPLEPSA
ncbi:MAG TPA: type I secretion system permease/ATPase [Ramlibacter sp.]|nr:type I secretion system permease/ATPase [Ramlibacter sp.]